MDDSNRVTPDRRQRPTPLLSRYWLRGRRRGGGRRTGEGRNVYVDRYTRAEIGLVAWIVCASVADLGLTLVHIGAGGGEANPVMNWFLLRGGAVGFAAAKLGLSCLPALFLLIHARFRGTLMALWALGVVYAGVLAFHVVAAHDRFTA